MCVRRFMCVEAKVDDGTLPSLSDTLFLEAESHLKPELTSMAGLTSQLALGSLSPSSGSWSSR